MNSREYESALKDVLEDVALALEMYDPDYLHSVYMPQNVAGVERITVVEWLTARYEKRDRL